jgi:glycosyltransferase involved in cell wall biosynthesis
VSYEFPPKGGTQSQHVAALAGGLARRGWAVQVLTVADPPTFLLDAGLLADLPAGVVVHRAWSAEPTRALQWLRRRGFRAPAKAGADAGPAGAEEGAGSRGYTALPRWAIRGVQAFFVPDEKIGWSPFAQALAGRVAARAPFLAVVSVGPPFSSHAVARSIARRSAVPWLADLRDPIVGGYFFKPLTPINAWLLERFERGVVQGAAGLLAATGGIRDGIVARHPEAAGRVRVVPNGFDPAAFRRAMRRAGAGRPGGSASTSVEAAATGDVAPVPHEGFVVAYVGTFQGTIRPDVFLAAVSRLALQDPAGFGADVRVRFVGARDGETDAAVRVSGLEGVVERTGFVTHDEAIAAMLAADALLLVIGPEPEGLQILTSKLPEYFAAGRPVLALVPPDGAAAESVLRSGNGAVVRPDDVEGTVAALATLYADWRAGRRSTTSPAVVAEFDREVLLDGLDAQLCALVGSSSAGREQRLASAGREPLKALLVVSSSSTSGGGEKHVLDLLRRLPERGVEPVLACPRGGDLPARARELGVAVEPLEIASSLRPAQLAALARILRVHRPDIVHAHGSRAALFARLADCHAVSRCVYTLHGIHVAQAGSPVRRRALLCVERVLRARTARFVAVCASDAAKGARLGVLTAEKTEVVHNGVESPTPADGTSFLDESGAVLGHGEDEHLLVLSVGRLHEQKDHDTLLRAWKLVHAHAPDARLALVGDGPLRRDVLEAIRREGLESSVALLPPRPDIAPAYAAADVFVLSSRWEGLPLVVLEAMAYGLPVVATRVDGVPEAVADGYNGLLVPPGDPRALAGAIVRDLSDRDARIRMGAAGRERVEREFTLGRMVDGVAAVYREVAGSGHRRRPERRPTVL